MSDTENKETNQSSSHMPEPERPLEEQVDRQPVEKAEESPEPVVSGQRVAKNAIALYFRMFISMAVGFYASRVILNVLGVEDYGI